jgi:Ser/Thr protein kinase RdoA (MazF antagonist)
LKLGKDYNFTLRRDARRNISKMSEAGVKAEAEIEFQKSVIKQGPDSARRRANDILAMLQVRVQQQPPVKTV